MTVGADCRFLGVERGTFGSEPYLITVGNHVTLTGVRMVTHDGGVWVLREKYPDIDVVGRIVIGDNVFVGLGVIVLPGVTIGANSIVAAGSVVTRDVPPGSVVAGTPAKVIRTVAEYEQRVLPRAVHVRGLPPEEKRRVFLEHTEPRGEGSTS
ncbi:acyltransferase [Geodermatophilus sp. SYSU D00815]